MRGLSLILVLPWVAVGPARAQSFDCRKATSAAEKRICGDPALALADVALAKAFKAALGQAPAEAKALRADQRRWLAERRDRCGPDTCMRAVMLERAAALERFASRKDGVTGSYSVGYADLELLDLLDGTLRFSISATWQGMEPGQVHTGEICGLAKGASASWSFTDPAVDCALVFRLQGEGIAVEQSGTCGFGANVHAGGTYLRSSRRPPLLTLCALP